MEVVDDLGHDAVRIADGRVADDRADSRGQWVAVLLPVEREVALVVKIPHRGR